MWFFIEYASWCREAEGNLGGYHFWGVSGGSVLS